MVLKFKTLALASVLGVCMTAMAQPGPHGGPHGRPGAPHAQPPGHGAAGPQAHRPGPQAHRPGPQAHRPGPQAHRPGPQVAYPDYRRFQRGERLPPQYRQPQYVVNNWRAHGLQAPPRGYQWVQNGSDYVLAAVATGLISAVVIHALSN